MVLISNHEQLALQALDPEADIEAQFMWQINGGEATLAEPRRFLKKNIVSRLIIALPLYANRWGPLQFWFMRV